MFNLQKCSTFKNFHHTKMFTPQKCSPYKNDHPPKMFTLLKCPSYKNVHPTKMFTPTATKHLITQISDCRHTPINACISSTEGEVLRTHNCSWSSTRFRFNLKVKVRESESGMNFWYYQAGSNIK